VFFRVVLTNAGFSATAFFFFDCGEEVADKPRCRGDNFEGFRSSAINNVALNSPPPINVFRRLAPPQGTAPGGGDFLDIFFFVRVVVVVVKAAALKLSPSSSFSSLDNSIK
jgi:hypothetical protein